MPAPLSRLAIHLALWSSAISNAMSLEDLTQVRHSLRAMLAGMEVEPYAALAEEVERLSVAMVLPDGRRVIGLWTLKSGDGGLFLERQQMPRTSAAPIYRARLRRFDGAWRVEAIDVYTVHGR